MPRKRQGAEMVRVEKGIYRRPSGKYVVPIWDPAAGKRTYLHPDVPRGGFDTLREAKDYKARRELEKGQSESPETCDRFASRWPETHPRPEETTNAHNRERIKAFSRDFKDVPLRLVTRRMARLWVHGGAAPSRALEKVAAGWKGAERSESGAVIVPPHRQHYKTVRAMFNDAVDDGLLSANPFAALKVPEEKGRAGDLITILTPDEIDLLAATAAEEWGDWGAQMLGPMLAVAAGLGPRPGELFALRWSDVDFELDEVHIRRQVQMRTGREKLPKGEKTRVVMMIPMVRAALQKVSGLRQANDDHVFFSQSGRPFQQRTFWYYWARVRSRFHGKLPEERRAEIDPGFDLYELRHYFGSYLASLGVSPYDIADQMGNTPEMAMRVYIHTRSEDARDRVRQAVLDAESRAGRAAS